MEREIYRAQANQAARRGVVAPRRTPTDDRCEWFRASVGPVADRPAGELKICEGCESSLRGLIPPIVGVVLHGQTFTWNG